MKHFNPNEEDEPMALVCGLIFLLLTVYGLGVFVTWLTSST